MCKVLDRINTPKDLKVLSRNELIQLCGEIRQQMLFRLSATGGHVGSNLAIIEATVALHYVFDSPVDKIIFDVSHQCYAHKLLTGRKAAYTNPAQFSSVSGFTDPAESEHDIFSIGHTSTAISLACGLAKGRDVKGETHNVVALVGDGALSGGEAFEGLNNAAVLGSNIILIIVDVGVAEGHAVAMISGIAKAGGKPVFGVSSSFLQRAYDQLLSDLALNDSPAVILVFFAGIAGGSQTHMGVFDISLAANIPNIIYLAPTCKEEYFSMLEWGLNQKEHPVIIRVPGVETVSRDAALLLEYSYPAKYEIVEHGTTMAILALGKFFGLGESVREKLAAEYGIYATLINPRYASAVDETMLNALPEYGHRLIVTLEDGIIDGGFGEKIAGFYGTSSVKVLNFGAKKEFVNHVTAEEQYYRYHLTPEQIVLDILEESEILLSKHSLEIQRFSISHAPLSKN